MITYRTSLSTPVSFVDRPLSNIGNLPTCEWLGQNPTGPPGEVNKAWKESKESKEAPDPDPLSSSLLPTPSSSSCEFQSVAVELHRCHGTHWAGQCHGPTRQ